eukprot:TRINITY_DN28568_c0_g1_i1.p1 TRINITY_DN28568_c0_g1~~TRINITY_DN28568_c0_g1_i1.p1  ORF type:complete len:119 (-),score=0.53 TRINITY_DN28568_c0_g1_i1:2-358(-)
MFFWREAELAIKCLVPYHVVPNRHDRVRQRQHTAIKLSFIPDVAILLIHANHDSWHLRAADEKKESNNIIHCLCHMSSTKLRHEDIGNTQAGKNLEPKVPTDALKRRITHTPHTESPT